MKTMLRNAARRWANRMLVRSNDTLRRQLISAEARVRLRNQAMRHGTEALDAARAELAEVTARLAATSRANLLLSARVVELEQTIVAMGAQAVNGVTRGLLDDAWGDVAAAGVNDGRTP